MSTDVYQDSPPTRNALPPIHDAGDEFEIFTEELSKRQLKIQAKKLSKGVFGALTGKEEK